MDARLSNEIQASIMSIGVAEKAFLRERDSQIASLKGQLAVAEKLGITEPITTINEQTVVRRTDRLGQESSLYPSYFRGSRAIQAELDIISSRGLEDAILVEPDLRLLYERRDALLAENQFRL